MYSNTTGDRNTAIGRSALKGNTIGSSNVAIGVNTLITNSTGNNNSAVGRQSLHYNTTGNDNCAFGKDALFSSTTGNNNTAIGMGSIFYNTTGENNTAIGAGGLGANTTGNNNITLGYLAGANITTGSNNIIVGYDINAPIAAGSNQMSIGNLIYATGVDGTGTIVSTGNVGVGTNAPTEKLEVAGGNIKTSGSFISGTTTYPDYVFEDYYEGKSEINNEYSFQSLEEIERFITKNKHLPGIKPIEEITTAEGDLEINMTEISIKNLEKIEELYLHLIEVNNEKVALADKVIEQGEKLASQEQQLEMLRQEIVLLKELVRKNSKN